MTEEQRYDQIELYLKGKLHGDDLKNFESQLNSDPSLKQELEIQKLGRLTIQSSYMTDMKSKLKDTSASYKKGQSLKWYLGGTLIVVGILTFVFWPNTEKIKTEVVSTDKSGSDHIEKHFPEEKIVKVDSQETHVVHHYKADNASHHISEIEASNDIVESEMEVSITDTIAEGIYVVTTTNKNSNDQLLVEESTEGVYKEKSADEQVDPIAEEVIKPRLKFRVKESNYDANNGRIDIVNEDGGTLEYRLKGDLDGFTTSNHFDEIAEGSYTILVRDKDGNEFAYESIEVNKSACFEKTDYVFNVTYDDHILLPVASQYEGVAVVMDKSGNQVFTKEFNNLTELPWLGLDINGQESTVGLHKVIIKYNHGETCAYNVLLEK